MPWVVELGEPPPFPPLPPWLPPPWFPPPGEEGVDGGGDEGVDGGVTLSHPAGAGPPTVALGEGLPLEEAEAETEETTGAEPI